jgi:hypothetical protein
MIHVANWCTPGPYAELAKANRELSLKNIPGLDFNTIEVISKGRWVENCNQKPDIALTAIRQVPTGEGVLLIDADAYLQGKPNWDSLRSAFFGYVLWKRPSNGAMVCLSGTLWLTNTNQCIDFVQGWKARCQHDQGIWDQAHLWQCVKGHVAGSGQGPDIFEMPPEWAWMEGNSIEPRHMAYVCHTQASRELKNDNTHQACIEIENQVDASLVPDANSWNALGDRGSPPAISEKEPEAKRKPGRPKKS